ncbi:MAG: gliding motility-associated-like protein [Flavobacteriaceae bacterium]|jgi:gliding motility-associated-like protein
MNYLKLISCVVALAAMTTTAKAQCVVSVLPGSPTISCGDSILLSAIGLSASPALSTDFNGGVLGPGWATSATVLYSNPCGPSLDGTPAAWFGNVPLPRTLTTNAFDVSCGGQVCFDLDFAADDACGGCSDCEDPDLTNEGVFFQYSIGGAWIDIFYFSATAGYANAYYSWDNYCFSIPPAAWGPATQFRWTQPSASSSVNDHWGIDNVIITPSNCGYVYDWAHVIGTDDPQGQTVGPTATTDYYIAYYDTVGIDTCYDTVTVIVNPLTAAVTATANSLACGACTDLNVAMVSDPNPQTYTYTWLSSLVSDSTIAAPSICPPEGSSTYIAVITNDTTGCTAMDSTTLVTAICSCFFMDFTATTVCQPGQVFDIVGDFQYAYSPTTGSITVEATNGSGTFSQSLPPPFTDSTSFNYTMTGIPNDGTPTTVTIFFTDSLSCTATLVVFPPVLPTVTTVDGGATYCSGDVVSSVLVGVTGTGPFTLEYTLDGVPMTASSALSPFDLGTAPGVYVITGVLDQICSNIGSGTTTIIVNELPTVDAGPDRQLCVGDPTIVSGSGANSYAWDNGVIDGLIFTPGATSTYIVTGTDGNGCVNTDEVTITVHPYPLAPNVGTDGLEYCLNTDFFPFTTDGTASQYTWYTDPTLIDSVGGDGLFMPYNVIGDNTYYVTQTENGCESPASPVSIIVVGCVGVLVVPNIITAGGDGINEIFTPVESENIVSMHTIILNRWGNLIYETDDLDINWFGVDATGGPVEDGTYFWRINYVDLSGGEVEVHGFVQVVK